ncbi:MAG: hypothetical protein RIQ93_1510 [Verrucomicrobiota bacterium]|jgi:hypothetical protein
MSKKTDRAANGPSWTEVIFGAALSLGLGVVLGAALLIIKPVTQVKELPKEEERDASAVYYIEGSRETAKAQQALAKRKAFVEGQSVSATEDEINLLMSAAPAAAAAKPGSKSDEKAAPSPTASGELVTAGLPNFRIRDGALQIGVPVTIRALGLNRRVIVQVRGGFEKKADGFSFEHSELYVGSCPVQRLPFVAGFVRHKVLAGQPVPEDIATAWKKVSRVAIEGNTVKVAMQ